MRKKYLISGLLMLFGVTVLLAQNEALTIGILNGNGHSGYYKTYEDFLTGKMVEGQYTGCFEKLNFKVNGELKAIDKNEVWGFRDGKNRLVRINKKDLRPYAVYAIGDIIYYDDLSVTPGEPQWSGNGLMLLSSFDFTVKYHKDGSVTRTVFGDVPTNEMISANLNSPLISVKDFEYEANFLAFAAGDTNLLKINCCVARKETKKGRRLINEANFMTSFVVHSHPKIAAFSRNRGQECYFGEYH